MGDGKWGGVTQRPQQRISDELLALYRNYILEKDTVILFYFCKKCRNQNKKTTPLSGNTEKMFKFSVFLSHIY